MKTLTSTSRALFLLLLATGPILAGRDAFKAMKRQINAQGKHWHAKLNAKFNYEDLNAMKNRLGNQVDPNPPPIRRSDFPRGPRLLQTLTDPVFPASLDLRQKYPNCLSVGLIRDQGNCASCWAIASMNSISDRWCIKKTQEANQPKTTSDSSIPPSNSTASTGPTPAPIEQRMFSVQDPLECCSTCQFLQKKQCSGGFIYQALSYAKTTGVASGDAVPGDRGCKPYAFLDDELNPSLPATCTKSCTDNAFTLPYTQDKFKISGLTYGKVESAMIKELNLGGSLIAQMSIYTDFYIYQSGIYEHVNGDLLGAHAVRIIGYGEESGVKFWLVANSWGENWGENGFFKIRRGPDECGIQTSYFYAPLI